MFQTGEDCNLFLNRLKFRAAKLAIVKLLSAQGDSREPDKFETARTLRVVRVEK